jgi:serine/threonine-protein kinase
MSIMPPMHRACEPVVVPSVQDSKFDDSTELRLDRTLTTSIAARETFGNYELLEVLGKGQFGQVWRARDRRLDRVVALKLPYFINLDESSRETFLREARAAAKLEYPHIVRIYGVEQVGDRLGIASQFIEGQTLYELLQDRCLAPESAAQLMATVADALHHAHEAGVIHRDLKPSNILVDNRGEPHVCDFGLAKWNDDQAVLPDSGIVLGTPAYMSPEQAGGESHYVDRRTDVYSLGAILYELLTGRPPFEGSSTLLLHQIQRQAPAAPRSINPDVPADLETVCLKCLAKFPDGRYATARELAEDLRRFLNGQPIVARPVGVGERCLSWTRRNPAMAAALLISLISSMTAVGFGFSHFSRAERPAVMPSLVVRPISVTVATEPPNAQVVLYPIEELTGEPDYEQAIRPPGKSPITIDLLPGDYLVVAAIDETRFHEVYRHVPSTPSLLPDYYPHRYWKRNADGGISFYPITILPHRTEGMSLVSTIHESEPGHPWRNFKSFLLDQHEVTIGDFLREFHNQLPPSIRHKPHLLSQPELPITGLFFDEAMMYAEMVGKRLPTASEYEFAATNGGTTRFPWGDTKPPMDCWKLTSVHENLFDRTKSDEPVWGLFSNASEFVISPLNLKYAYQAEMYAGTKSANVAIRGGPTKLDESARDWMNQDPRAFVAASRHSLLQRVGFRCAKSKSPRL